MALEVFTPGGHGNDAIIVALDEIMQTMGGTPSAVAEAEEPAAYQQTPAIIPAEQLNVGVEGKLCDLGVFGKRSVTQRQVLGCIACILGTSGESSTSLHSTEVARCHGKDNGSIIRVLRKLVSAEILEAANPPKQLPKLPISYTFAPRAVQSSFRGALQGPKHCGLENGSAEPNRSAENLLIETGVTVQRSDVTRIILGCLACRLEAGEPGIFTSGVSECTGFRRTSVLKALDPMVAGDVLRVDTEEGRHTDGRPRRNYQPAETELGQDLAAVLEVPQRCGLIKNSYGMEDKK